MSQPNRSLGAAATSPPSYYEFDERHPFFVEILTYAINQVTLTFGHHLASGTQPPDKIFAIANRGAVVEGSALLDPATLLSLFVSKQSAIKRIRYSELQGLPQAGRKPADYFVPPNSWRLLAQVCLGSAFERVKEVIETQYKKDADKWPREIDYLRHVRNGCFHGNKFNIDPKHSRLRHGCRSVIDPNSPPTWRSSCLADDQSVHNKAVLGSCLEAGDVPILLGDVANRLKLDGVVTF